MMRHYRLFIREPISTRRVNAVHLAIWRRVLSSSQVDDVAHYQFDAYRTLKLRLLKKMAEIINHRRALYALYWRPRK